jgi:tRNA-dihydrouridine synthase C
LAGAPAHGLAALTWPQLLPHIADFWLLVSSRLDAKSRAGRLKQWLNFLRRRFPEAEVAYQQLKTVNDPVAVSDWLARQQESLFYCSAQH